MISATYFGEIAELDSRAVWYSDEEDDDDEKDDDIGMSKMSISVPIIEPLTHKTFRSTIKANFTRILPVINYKFKSCIVSLSSSTQFKVNKINNMIPCLGHFDTFGKAFVIQSNQDNEHVLWLVFDSSHPYVSGQEVSYFVESLREQLQCELNLDVSSQIILISQQYSNGEHLEYLSNFKNTNSVLKLPFKGFQLLPPSIIKSQFESALFEQLTLSLKPALLVCLPSPKNYWFDRVKYWPTIPEAIIEHKLNDDPLEKTLIFT